MRAILISFAAASLALLGACATEPEKPAASAPVESAKPAASHRGRTKYMRTAWAAPVSVDQVLRGPAFLLRSRCLKQVDKRGEGVRHRPRLHCLASNASVAHFQMPRFAILARHGDADQPDWIAVFVGIRTGDAGDGHGQIRR